ncbi:MAG: hypothetical protein LUC22_06505 [Prevotella sp.]|nr:hypothetical protein [Prevotella sp.]
MHKYKDKEETLQTRRQFFRNVAGAILPAVGAIGLAVCAAGCTYRERQTHNNNYNQGCKASCAGECTGQCNLTCKGDCMFTCSSSCYFYCAAGAG